MGKIVPATILVLLCAMLVQADEFYDLEIHVKQLSPKAIRLWIGDQTSSTAVVAFATEKGIVVVDGTQCPAIDTKFREIIAREFGRDDFACLINTHEHADHTFGNQVYADCEIVAHEYCADGIKGNFAGLDQLLARTEGRLQELENLLKEGQSDAETMAINLEYYRLVQLYVKSYKAGMTMTLPTKTFADTMKLDMGDMTFELYSTGGMHSASDIMILVPEEGLLLTGDVMADQWFNQTPGCLASFAFRSGVKRDFPRTLANLERIVARKGEIKDLVPGHWNGDISMDGFEKRCHYAKTLWEGVNAAVADGKYLDEIQAEYALQTRFPEMVGSPGIDERLHAFSIRSIWLDVSDAESAAEKLSAAIEKGNLEGAIKATEDLHGKQSNKIYFDEREFNALGYRFLGEQRFEEAIAVFKLNVKMYPDSWNVYDSLAEGYMLSGDNDKAIEFYEKSIEMNPNNDNGRHILARIRNSK